MAWLQPRQSVSDALTIAVGFVVDDAIVMQENIFAISRMASLPWRRHSSGAGEIGFTILSISFSLIAVFIPPAADGGIVGRLFREFAITVTTTILVLRGRVAHAHTDDCALASAPANGM